MPYRNKTYVCFDGDNDMHYYRLMQAWHQSDYSTFRLYNAHDLNSARDTSQEASIKRQLRERLLNTKVFVVLIGGQTRYLYKFVRWEMEQAISLNLPIIGVNLNGLRKQDPERCPPVIRNVLAVYISFNSRILEYALENWINLHYQYQKQGKGGPFYYEPETYQRLGL
ncbi:TIR domain-containing protein [Nodosilinea sp. LEGE 07088]|uniref:TIR domain-containing protein n=1 Tax=Nodosilinea sp. LEGE 07088 TaxID=2777968 RepID=UPI0018819297|nr:TIR domain-containing protein [Nodosilinea sp. LEGE 07088]MBE9138508.1 TIR domain-containing protein [Nodosilinea sp. LEGE 07088]